MNEVDFSSFDKLLLELVFQNDQESQNKRNTKELIQRYGVKILHEKQQVLALKKDISLSDEIILDLQKYNRNNSDNLVTCSSMSAVLEREEEFLQIQLENAINTSENDKKSYQDSMNKCKDVLKQHEEKYMEFTFAKKYHAIKEELDSILKVIFKYDEQQKRKDKIIQDILEPASFGSYIDWSLRLATVRKNTNETVHHISQVSRTKSEMMQKIDELEQKIKYIDEHTKDVTEKENEIRKKGSNKNHTTEFQEIIPNEEGTRRTQSKEKRPHLLHLPDLPQKFMRPPRETKLYFSETDTDNRRKVGDPQISNRCVSKQDPCVEKGIQEPLINNGSKGFIPPTTNLQLQGQLRLGFIQKQIHSKMDIKESEVKKQQFTEVPDTSKDSGYFSQGNSVSYEDMECKADGEISPNEVFALPRIPSPFTIPNPPSISTNTSIRKCDRNKGKKSQNFTKSTMDLFSKTIEQTEASPCLNLFKTSTPKTPSLCSFESFATVRFSDQQESFASADTHPTSPAKDIGSLFEKMGGDNDFAFLFASKSSQPSDDDKDDFGFMLPFGQDVRNSMDFESGQNETKFTFF
ncbi:protein SIX6OS1 isoform X2 [Rhinoderma darwinii]|uniref:protein SIX6OS1 isoform X2 n=1 Tax=Rhinoderma darwinii TaxID=43563 RepID=UPI003F66F2A1